MRTASGTATHFGVYSGLLSLGAAYRIYVMQKSE